MDEYTRGQNHGLILGMTMGLQVVEGERSWFVIAGAIEAIYSIKLYGYVARIQAIADNVRVHPSPLPLRVPFGIAEIQSIAGETTLLPLETSGAVSQIQSIVGEVIIHG